MTRAVNDASPFAGAVLVRRGFDLTASPLMFSNGTTVHAEELDRIEVRLGVPGYSGYVRTGDGLAPLPIGSRLDIETGVFTWGVGVGFLRDFDLVFVRWLGNQAADRVEMRVAIGSRQTNHAGTQVTIDTPAPGATVGRSFLLGGWAADLDAVAGTGVETLHVWAYPVSADHTAAPIFLGATVYGGRRPDVASIFGSRYRDSGFGLEVDALPPGTYDLAVFAWSTVTEGFAPAKVVRVVVR